MSSAKGRSFSITSAALSAPRPPAIKQGRGKFSASFQSKRLPSPCPPSSRDVIRGALRGAPHVVFVLHAEGLNNLAAAERAQIFYIFPVLGAVELRRVDCAAVYELRYDLGPLVHKYAYGA